MYMSFDKAIKRYKTAKAIKEKFGYSYARISSWKKTGLIPEGPAYRMKEESKGKLKMDRVKK